MRSKKEKAAQRQLGGGPEAAGSPPHSHSTTSWRPVAIEYWKRGRWCVLAKVVPLEGEPVLAVAIRHQRGTERVLSLPVPVLEYAEAVGCRWLYRRDDRQHTMGRIRIEDMWRLGWTGPDGEPYVELSDLEPVAWRSWIYVQETMRVGNGRQPAAPEANALRQATLWG